MYNNNIKIPGQLDTKCTNVNFKTPSSYRGFVSIDQEIEREIALQWFAASGKSSFTKRQFILKKEKV